MWLMPAKPTTATTLPLHALMENDTDWQRLCLAFASKELFICGEAKMQSMLPERQTLTIEHYWLCFGFFFLHCADENTT